MISASLLGLVRLYWMPYFLRKFSFQVQSVNTREYRHVAEHSHSLQKYTEKNYTSGTIWNPLQYETTFETRQREKEKGKIN